jgi:hypothetical protein
VELDKTFYCAIEVAQVKLFTSSLSQQLVEPICLEGFCGLKMIINTRSWYHDCHVIERWNGNCFARKDENGRKLRSPHRMKQILWIHAVLLGLSLVFMGLSVVIFVFGPRPGLIAQKLRLGAVIISLNTMLAGCYASSKDTETVASSDDPPESPTDYIDCYDTEMPSDDPPESPTDDTDTATPSSDWPEYPTEDIECYDCYEYWGSDDGWGETDSETDTDTPSDMRDAGPDSGTDG